MIRLALRGLAERRLRSALTAVAIVIGVAMIAGTYVQTDRMHAAFGQIMQTTNRGTAVVVRAEETFDSAADTSPAAVPETLAGRLRSVPGVARVAGRLETSGSLVVRGEPVSSGSAPAVVLSAVGPPFDPLRMVAGRAASRSGEVVVNRALAEDRRLAVGDRAGLATGSGVRRVRISGIADYGTASSLGGATLVVPRLVDVQRWYGRAGRVSELLVSAAPGVDETTLARRVADAVPAGLEVRTGSADARASADAAAASIDAFLTPALLALAGAALLVGAFIIFNTFSITVAQRTREFALLRALGATRRNVLAVVAAEAALLGVLASVVGLFAGLGVATLLGELFDAAGFGVPVGAPSLAPRTIALSLGVGVGVTLLASVVPARRATRVSPVAALRTGASSAAPRSRWLRPALSVVVVLAAAGLLTAAVLGAGGLVLVATGAVLLFVGVALLAEHAVRPLAAVIGWPLARAFDEPGRLARDNAMRNPARTATSAATLMVGIGMVVFVAVVAAGLKGSITGSLDGLMRADVMVTGDGTRPLPARAGRLIAQVPGVRSVAPYLAENIRVNGSKVSTGTDSLDGMAPEALLDVYAPDWVEGSDATVRELRDDRVLIEEGFAEAHALRVGEPFTIEVPMGRTARVTAVGVYRDPVLLGGMIIASDRFAALTGRDDPFGYFLAAEPGRARAAVAGVEAALARAFPAAKVESRAAYRAGVEARVDTFVYLLYAMLAMSVLISLLGIVNSLFLAVFERTREFGLLRAVGATQRQVRQVVRYESVITAVIGAAMGTVVGLAFAVLATVALGDLGLRLAVPVGQLVAFLAVAVAVGVVGAALPARRAARVDVLTAMRDD